MVPLSLTWVSVAGCPAGQALAEDVGEYRAVGAGRLAGVGDLVCWLAEHTGVELVHLASRVVWRLVGEDHRASDGEGLDSPRRGPAGVGDQNDVRDTAALREHRARRDVDRLVGVGRRPGQQPELILAVVHAVTGEVDH